jgi:hypothetical protein
MGSLTARYHTRGAPETRFLARSRDHDYPSRMVQAFAHVRLQQRRAKPAALARADAAGRP